MNSVPTIRRLGRDDAAAFRALRLEALQRHPGAFGTAYEEAVALPVEAFVAQVTGTPPSDAVFGAFDDGGALAGIAGFLVRATLKERHKGYLWGVYVAATARGQGLARRLVRQVIEHARAQPGVELVQLTVAADNPAARALYESEGFVLYGVERHALKLGDAYVDEENRVLDLAGR